MPRLKGVDVSLKFPPFSTSQEDGNPTIGSGRRRGRWYVELVTRISVVELKPHEGLLSEALSSLYTLFDTTREILKRYGPTVAQPKGEAGLSFGYLAVEILNRVLRPVLAYWHPLLLDYESTRDHRRRARSTSGRGAKQRS